MVLTVERGAGAVSARGVPGLLSSIKIHFLPLIYSERPGQLSLGASLSSFLPYLPLSSLSCRPPHEVNEINAWEEREAFLRPDINFCAKGFADGRGARVWRGEDEILMESVPLEGEFCEGVKS